MPGGFPNGTTSAACLPLGRGAALNLGPLEIALQKPSFVKRCQASFVKRCQALSGVLALLACTIGMRMYYRHVHAAGPLRRPCADGAAPSDPLLRRGWRLRNSEGAGARRVHQRRRGMCMYYRHVHVLEACACTIGMCMGESINAAEATLRTCTCPWYMPRWYMPRWYMPRWHMPRWCMPDGTCTYHRPRCA